MIKIIGATDKGKVRKENQDAYIIRQWDDNCGYAMVCDGMGGEKAGDVASRTVCDLIAKFLDRDLRNELSENSVKSVLLSAISAANAKVYSMAKEEPAYCGMGTTLVLAVVMGNQMHVVNVGDSRVYLVSEDALQQITHDHTVVQTLVDRGEISEQQAANHPQRHYITRAVGVSDALDVDYQLFDLAPTGAVLLCSDGLTGYGAEETLYPLVRQAMDAQDASPLIEYANQQGGMDNVTAVVIYQG